VYRLELVELSTRGLLTCQGFFKRLYICPLHRIPILLIH
jgi:hypothetical protein